MLKQQMSKITCSGVTSETYAEVVSCSAPATNGDENQGETKKSRDAEPEYEGQYRHFAEEKSYCL